MDPLKLDPVNGRTPLHFCLSFCCAGLVAPFWVYLISTTMIIIGSSISTIMLRILVREYLVVCFCVVVIFVYNDITNNMHMSQ